MEACVYGGGSVRHCTLRGFGCILLYFLLSLTSLLRYFFIIAS